VAHDQNEGDDVVVFVFPPLFPAPVITAFGGNEAKAKAKGDGKVRQRNLGQESENCIRERNRNTGIRIPRGGWWSGIMGCMWHGITTWPSCCLAVYSCSLTHHTHTLSFFAYRPSSFPANRSKRQTKKLPHSAEY